MGVSGGPQGGGRRLRWECLGAPRVAGGVCSGSVWGPPGWREALLWECLGARCLACTDLCDSLECLSVHGSP